MTSVNYRTRPNGRSFNNVLDTFFGDSPSVFRDDLGTPPVKQFVLVNVKESENSYQLEIVAPGFDKEAFQVNLEKNLLTIAADIKSDSDQKKEQHIRREYQQQSFKRSFTLDEGVDGENIDAKYVNGILVVTLPKKAETKPAVKQISIQ